MLVTFACILSHKVIYFCDEKECIFPTDKTDEYVEPTSDTTFDMLPWYSSLLLLNG